jgi:hypothetical protein
MEILAHAFGKRYDLPIPLWLFVIGGALVVIASFLLIAPRGRARAIADPHGHSVATAAEDPARDAAWIRGLHPGWGTLSVIWLAFLIWCGLIGSQEVAENIIVTWLWLLVWIAVPLSVAIVGDWTQPVNPFAFLSKVADSAALRRAVLGSPDPVRWPDWLGWWPAVVLFFLGACGELIYNLDTTVPQEAAEILLGYAVFTLLMGFLFGREWLRRGEMFTVLFDTWGRLGFFRFGAPGRRGFAGGLERGFSRHPSRIAFVLLMLLNVNFDGLLSTPQWADVLRQLPNGYNQPTAGQHYFNTIVFAVMTVVLAVLLLGFAQGSATVGQHRTRPLASLTGLLPSLVPIAFGYLLAHNLEYILINGQLLFPLLGNPPGGDGNWPLAPHMPYPFNDSYEINHSFLPSGFYWYVSLVVIIAVHVYAVILAHRHLVRVGVNRRLEMRSEYPWLLAMVGYTCLSLWLLAQPLTQETSSTSGLAPAQPISPSSMSALPLPNDGG